MTCRSLIQALSIYGTAVILSACGVQNQPGLERADGDFAIRSGEVVKTPATGLNPDNPAQYVVMVQTQNTTCTGSLIGRRMVLTAAHCLNTLPKGSTVVVLFGLNNKIDEKNKYIKAEDYRFHEDFDISTKFNDVALVELSEDAPAEFKTLELPTNLILPYEMKITATGYGMTHGRYDDSDAGGGILRKVDLKLFVSDARANLLTYNQAGPQGTCFGDSGGPAIFRSVGRYYVVGVMSSITSMPTSEMRYEMAEPGVDPSIVFSRFPQFDKCKGQGAYTNVKLQLPWILKNAAQLRAAPAPESDSDSVEL